MALPKIPPLPKLPDLPPPREMWTRARSAILADVRAIRWSAVALNIAMVLGGVTVFLAILLLSLNTPPGRRLLVQYATGIKLNSGLQIEIGDIDGSLYGDMTLHNVKVKDLKGVFITSPLVHLNWRPFGYAGKHVDIRDLSSPRIDILRRPVLNPEKTPKKTGPILPDLKIDVNRVQVDTIALAGGVFTSEGGGDARNAMLSGSAHIDKGRAQLDATTLSDKGDRLVAKLDARPADNRLDIDASLTAPPGGIIADALKLTKTLSLTVGGKGSWADWRGKAVTLLDADTLTDLTLTAQKGTFHVAGDTRPDHLIGGESVALLLPAVHVDATAKVKDRKLDLVTALSSDAAKVDATGIVDLGGNRFDHLEVHARLLQPEKLGRDITGDDLHADLLFDGAFNDWKVEYDIAAKRFGLGQIHLANLDARGKSRRDGDRIIVPLNGSLDTLSGINERVDPLLTKVRLTGDLAVLGTTINSKNLSLRTSRLQASGDLQGDLSTFNFASNVKASLNGYVVDNVGTVNVATAARVARDDKLFSLSGTFSGQTTKLSDSLQKVLGGNARASGGYALGPNNAFSLRGVKGSAPLLQVLSGDATFGPHDALRANLNANSTQYGPLEAAVTGTFAAPQAVVKAEKPGLGVGLVDVVANLSGTPEGYAVTATGGSTYGPVSGDVLVLKGTPLTIDIHKAQFAGIDAQGRLTQTDGGPFAGTLGISGSGLTGQAVLSNAGGDQAALITASGSQIAVPGGLDIHAGRAILSANVLVRKELELTADVQAADLTYAGVTVSTGRAKVQLHGKTGTIQAVASGKRELPFDLAVNGDIAPNLYTFAAKGSVNGIPLSLDHPARVSRSGGDWVLAPVAVTLDGGKLNLAGRFGATKTVQARLVDVDLAVANLFRKDLGIDGRANGSIDFSQAGDGFPAARATLKITGFSRASAAVVSTPVDMSLEATLDPSRSPSRNYVHAIIRQAGPVIGRIQLDLTPSGSGGWIDQVMNAGIGGGVRYNGPAGVPFSLAGLARQQLAGPVALAADFSGRLNAPQLNGVIKANSLTYDNDTFGTRISSLALDGHFSNDRLELTSFAGKAGEGTVKGSGWVSLAADQHFPLQLHADLSNARLARSDSADSTVSGTLDISNNQKDGATIAGDLRLPELKYTVVRQGASEVSVLDGVHRKGEDPQKVTADVAVPSLWKLDIRAVADNRIFVSGMGLESEWRMNLHLIGTTRAPRVLGELSAIRGTYSFAGRDFTIDDGAITFDGGSLTNPEIKLTATAVVNDITGVINVSGSAQRPDIAFTSTPALPQDEVLSRILFGESVANISATEALQLASAVNGLNGGTDYLNPLGALRSATGIDRLRMVGADATTGRGTSLAAGKYLTNNVYVEIVTDTKGFTATQIEIALSRALSVLSQTGSANGTTVSVRYSKDY